MNDLLFITVYMMAFVVPITFFIGLAFLISGKIKGRTNEEIGKRNINIGFKFFSFAVVCLLIGYICFKNLKIY